MKLYLQYEVISQSHFYHFGEWCDRHIISTQKTIIQHLVFDIYLHVSSFVFRYFTAFVNL